MIQVTKALKAKQLKAEQCPEALRERITALKQLTDKYNEACDVYDEEEEENKDTEKELDRLENLIAIDDKELAQEILAISTEEPAPAAAEETPAPAPVEEKKSSNTGFWVLAGTLVAGIIGVNFMKNR